MKYTMFKQRMERHNEFLRKQENQPFYSMLLDLSENLMQITTAIAEVTGDDIKVSALEEQVAEVEALIEEIEEVFAAIIKKPLGELVMKQVFEALDQPLAILDDLIEDINEYGITKGKNVPYIEAWDIGFFFE